MPELSPKTKQYQKQRLRSLMVLQPMISTLGMQQQLAKDSLPLDRAAGLKEACEAYNHIFQMLFDAGVFERRIGIGKRRCRRECFCIEAKSLTHALTANPVIGHLGWHTDSSERSNKFAQTASAIGRNVDRTRGYVSPAPKTLHIPPTTQNRPGDVDL